MIATASELEDFFRFHGPTVEQTLDRALIPPPSGSVDHLHDGMRFGVGLDEGGSGKRVRPLLCLLTSAAIGGSVTPALPFAAAIELMHSFALVHDDIEDGDEWRRGQPAVWKRHGLPHAINIGDGLLARAFGVLAESNHPPALQVRLMRLLSDTLMETIEGQALDMNARNRSDIKVEAYMDLVTRKTGRYLAAPLVGGALCAGASETTIQLLANLGPILGPLFQILDDLIDLSKGKGRESIGNDVREGKRSYLAVHTLNHATPAQQVRLQQILDAPREQTTLDMVSEAADLMERTGAMEAARQEAQRLRGAARRKMAGLYPPALAQALSVVLDYLASRQQ